MYRKRSDPPGFRECLGCGIKPVSDFYLRGKYLMSRCKFCWGQNVREFRNTDKGRAMRRRIAKKYLNTPAGKQTTAAAKKRNREKILARGLLNAAIRDGRVLRESCKICGDWAEGHHTDYTQPLVVEWLCRTHHHLTHDI